MLNRPIYSRFFPKRYGFSFKQNDHSLLQLIVGSKGFVDGYKEPPRVSNHIIKPPFSIKNRRREIGEIVRYLPDKKIACLSDCRYYRPKFARASPQQCTQISFKSVHFRRSYSRTREHCQNAP